MLSDIVFDQRRRAEEGCSENCETAQPDRGLKNIVRERSTIESCMVDTMRSSIQRELPGIRGII